MKEIEVTLQSEDGKYLEFTVTRDLDTREEVESFFQTVDGMQKRFGLTLVKLEWTNQETGNQRFNIKYHELNPFK